MVEMFWCNNPNPVVASELMRNDVNRWIRNNPNRIILSVQTSGNQYGWITTVFFEENVIPQFDDTTQS